MSEPRRSRRSDPEAATSDQAASADSPDAEPEGPLDLFGRPYRRPEAFPVEKSGDPLGGRAIDDPVYFWWWKRRRASTTYDDVGIPTAPLDDQAPVSRSVLRERFAGLRSRWFPLPDEVVHSYLGSGEQVLHTDHPSFRSFVVDRWLLFLVLIGVGVGFVYSLGQGWTLAAQILFGLLAALVLALFVMRMGDRYTSYVITNARMIRMSGVVSRKIESIPWVRVTDVGFQQSFFERMLGFATVNIESANENMGLRHMRGIADPVTFNHHLMDMVVAKQGPATPLGRRSEYRVLAQDKGLFGRRRRRQEESRNLVLDDSSPVAGTRGPIDDDRTEVITPAAEPAETAADPGGAVPAATPPLSPGETATDRPDLSDI